MPQHNLMLEKSFRHYTFRLNSTQFPRKNAQVKFQHTCKTKRTGFLTFLNNMNLNHQ